MGRRLFLVVESEIVGVGVAREVVASFVRDSVVIPILVDASSFQTQYENRHIAASTATDGSASGNSVPALDHTFCEASNEVRPPSVKYEPSGFEPWKSSEHRKQDVVRASL